MTRLVGWGRPSIGLLARSLVLSVNNLILGPKPLREMNYVSPSFGSAPRPKAAFVGVFLAAARRQPQMIVEARGNTRVN